MGWAERFLGRHPAVDPKEIHFHKNPDGSLDTTPRILLVFPIFAHVLPDAFAAFMHMALVASRHCPTYKFDLLVRERELLHSAMNTAAESCIKNPWYAGMIAFDDDCLPPPNLVSRMVQHYEHGHHVVAGLGFMRRFPHTTTVGRLYKDGPILHTKSQDGKIEGEQRGFEWVDDISTMTPDEHGLIQADFCGMPAMFISRKALVSIDPPHFMHEDKTGAVLTHDIYFCNKARDKGYKIEVDTTLECAHISAPFLITAESRAIARRAVDEAQARPHVTVTP